MTFRPIKGSEGDTEMYLEQPQGNFVLASQNVGDAAQVAGSTTNYSGPLKPLPGSYQRNNRTIEITVKDGKVVLVVPGQPAYTLVEKERDRFGAAELPDSYGLTVKRDSAGKVSGIALRQPQGDFEFSRMAEPAATSVDLAIDEVPLEPAQVGLSGGGGLRFEELDHAPHVPVVPRLLRRGEVGRIEEAPVDLILVLDLDHHRRRQLTEVGQQLVVDVELLLEPILGHDALGPDHLLDLEQNGAPVLEQKAQAVADSDPASAREGDDLGAERVARLLVRVQVLEILTDDLLHPW